MNKSESIIHQISLYFPKKYKSKDKVKDFFSPLEEETKYMPVVKKRFPGKKMIQMFVKPFPNPKYVYCICMSPISPLSLSASKIHNSDCLIRFEKNNEEITATMFVREKY